MIYIINYLVRRLASVIPVLLIVAVMVFFIVHLIPGDPAAVMLGADATIEEIEAFRARMGLDKPLTVQFGIFFKNLLRGDLGESLYYNKPVTQAIFERLEPTVLLVAMSISIAILIGIPIGIIAGINRKKLADRIVMMISLIGVSTPAFWLGLNLILLFSIRYALLPSAGYIPISEGNIFQSMKYLILPAFSLGLQRAAGIARMTRSSMLDVLNNDYVRTARAKGLHEFSVVVKHALKNAMIPVITQIGLSIAHLAGGAVVTETIFNIPGIGQLAVASINRRDYPVIQGHVLFVAVAYIGINLIIDMLYKFFDPRVEYK